MYLVIPQEFLKDVVLRARDRRACLEYRCTGACMFLGVHLHMEPLELSRVMDAVLEFFLEVLEFFLAGVVELLIKDRPRCLLAILRRGHRRRAGGHHCGTTPTLSRRNSHRNLEINMMADPREESPGKS